MMERTVQRTPTNVFGTLYDPLDWDDAVDIVAACAGIGHPGALCQPVCTLSIRAAHGQTTANPA